MAWAIVVLGNMTTPLTPEFALLCWQRAFDDEFGLKLTFPELPIRQAAERILYEAREKSQNPNYQQLVITRMTETEIWLVKKTTDMRDVL